VRASGPGDLWQSAVRVAIILVIVIEFAGGDP